jgi:hypothetical protein
MAKRERGSGSLYLPAGTEVYWCQYYLHGQRYRKSTGKTNLDTNTICVTKTSGTTNRR